MKIFFILGYLLSLASSKDDKVEDHFGLNQLACGSITIGYQFILNNINKMISQQILSFESSEHFDWNFSVE
jgi:hypothetical protein